MTDPKANACPRRPAAALRSGALRTFEAAGLNHEKMSRRIAWAAESAGAMKDGKIDAHF
jgi:hypothetical protein